GGTLCIPSEGDLGSPARLLSLLATEVITVARLTPAVAEILTAEATGGQRSGILRSLRLAFFGGDRLTRRDVARLRACAPGVRCVNFYGTTETPQAMS